MMSNLVLFSFGTPDLMMAGAAVFAMLCGIVLMGGRSAVGLLLRVLANVRGRGLHDEPVVCLKFDRVHRQDTRDVQRDWRRAA